MVLLQKVHLRIVDRIGLLAFLGEHLSERRDGDLQRESISRKCNQASFRTDFALLEQLVDRFPSLIDLLEYLASRLVLFLVFRGPV